MIYFNAHHEHLQSKSGFHLLISQIMHLKDLCIQKRSVYEVFLIQAGLTVFFGLLKWIFIWTNNFEGSSFYQFINVILMLFSVSWLFSMGYLVRFFIDKKIKEDMQGRTNYLSNRLSDRESRLKEIESEKDKIYSLIKMMVERLGTNEIQAHVNLREQERSALNSFMN